MTIDDTLIERGARYGTFMDNAKLAQELKHLMQSAPRWKELRADQAEALEVIAQKISRILTGDPKYRDNWHDIVGYGKLVDDRMLREENEPVDTTAVRDLCKYCGAMFPGRHRTECPINYVIKYELDYE